MNAPSPSRKLPDRSSQHSVEVHEKAAHVLRRMHTKVVHLEHVISRLTNYDGPSTDFVNRCWALEAELATQEQKASEVETSLHAELATTKKDHMMERSQMQNEISMLQMEVCCAQSKMEEMQQHHEMEIQKLHSYVSDVENEWRRSAHKPRPDFQRHGGRRSPPSATASTRSGSASATMTPSGVSDYSYLDEPNTYFQTYQSERDESRRDFPPAFSYNQHAYHSERDESQRDFSPAPSYDQNVFSNKMHMGEQQEPIAPPNFRSSLQPPHVYSPSSPYHDRFGSSGSSFHVDQAKDRSLRMSDLKARHDSGHNHGK